MVRDKILIKEHLNQCFHWKSIIISTISNVEIVFLNIRVGKQFVKMIVNIFHVFCT